MKDLIKVGAAKLQLSIVIGLLLLPLADSAVAMEPSRVLGVENCAECHEKENDVWSKTKHATSMKEISRHKKTDALKDLLGLKRITREESCARCHFTNAYISKKKALPGGEPPKPELKTVDAVSCEFCHGEAKDWGPVHGDYGGKKVTKEMETAAHRADRIAKTKAGNLVGPKNMYLITKKCFSCHLLDDEKIANTKEHPIFTEHFEMVAWSQGDMRHNLWYSDGKKNVEAPIEKRRLYYVLGKTVSLEMLLRALATSTEDGPYRSTITKEMGSTLQDLQKIVGTGGPGEISSILNVKGSALNSKNLLESAEQVAEVSKRIAAKYDGKSLGSLDALLPKESDYKRLEK